MRCTIITIGDELLIGQTIDTNSAFIAQRLNEIGIAIHRRIAIADDADEIKSSIQEAWKTTDIIISTGGLGPTKDDITKKTIADLFDVDFKRDQKTYEHVKAFFESRNRPFLKVNEAQADVPENAEILFNHRGTAPGMWFDNNGKILVVLPGVPFEMKYLIETYVIAKLKNQFKIPALYYSYIQTAEIGESFLAEQIEDIESDIPSTISLSYLPSALSVNIRLSGNETQKEQIDSYANQIRERISKYVYGDSKTPIVEIVFDKLKERNDTISLVESCTGGYLANELTHLNSSSKVFKGGWVVYTDVFKNKELEVSLETIDKHTAVSEETAIELFKNALKKTQSTYAISVVGYLVKSESVPNPYAIICLGNTEQYILKQIDIFYPRKRAKEAIAKVAWVTLYKKFLC